MVVLMRASVDAASVDVATLPATVNLNSGASSEHHADRRVRVAFLLIPYSPINQDTASCRKPETAHGHVVTAIPAASFIGITINPAARRLAPVRPGKPRMRIALRAATCA
jgi:hypothetical protein